MRAARSVPVNGVAKGILPAGLPDSSSPRPAPVRRLSIKAPSEGRSAIHLAFRFRAGLAGVCTLASAKSPSLARSRHATRIRSARASSWTERATPSPPTQRARTASARSSETSPPAWPCSRVARPRTIACDKNRSVDRHGCYPKLRNCALRTKFRLRSFREDH